MTPDFAGRHTRRPRGEVGLAELAIALDMLPLTSDAHRASAAACLGFLAGAAEVGHEAQVAEDHRVRDRRAPPPNRHAAPKTFASPPVTLPHVEPAGEPLQATLTAGTVAASQRPDWADGEVVMPASDVVRAANRAALFPANVAPAILSAALAVVRPGRRIDVAKLIRQIVARRPVREVPRAASSGVEAGVQVLIDAGAAMAPYRQDFDDLVQALDRVVGRSRCEVFDYRTDPSSATRWKDGLVEQRWTPRTACPVLIVSDFGALGVTGDAPRLARRHWRKTVKACTTHKAPLIGLSPMAPHGAPGWLGDIVLLHWDRRTRAGYVRRQIGMGHGASRPG